MTSNFTIVYRREIRFINLSEFTPVHILVETLTCSRTTRSVSSQCVMSFSYSQVVLDITPSARLTTTSSLLMENTCQTQSMAVRSCRNNCTAHHSIDAVVHSINGAAEQAPCLHDTVKVAIICCCVSARLND